MNNQQPCPKGAALIEFVLIFPLLLLLLFGVIEYGIIIFDQNILINASRNGARYGIISQNSTYPSSATISSYITTHYTSNLVTFATTKPSPTITATSSVTPPVAGAQLTVTVTYPYTYVVLNKLAGLSSPLTLTATTVMAYE